MPYLLNISIGPVQEFIASARRCQDLWYGSWLLSDLSKAAAEHLKNNGAQAVIFPGGLADAMTLPKDSSAANKILAMVEGDETGVRQLAESARKAMLSELERLVEPVFKKAYQGLTGADLEEALAMARAQTTDLMEFQWVAVSFEENGYPAAREKAERLLMAVKNTKPWTQPSWSRVGWRKSSLDGARESVIPERFFEKLQGETEDQLAERIYKQFRVRPAERLCGVGLVKRWGSDPEAGLGKPNRFHSTSHMAAAPLRARAEAMKSDPVVGQAWQEYRNLLMRTPYPGRVRVQDLKHPLFEDFDGSILYKGRLREIFFAGTDSRRAEGPHKELCEAAEQALDKLLGALNVAEPNAYYALLLADGDYMGAAIDNQKTIGGHQKLSAQLDAFARDVRATVAKHGGSLIYSGGDDVMAMLPLNTSLDCAEELAKDFAEKLHDFPTTAGKLPTLSAGIAIAHHLEDFADVRTWADQAEKRAKNNGRNSLAIRLEKRGGSPVEAVGAWTGEQEKADVNSLFLPRLRDWIDRHKGGEVPNKLPFQWAELVRLAKDNAAMNPIVMMDAKRLVQRKGEGEAGAKNVSAIQNYLEKQTDPAVLESLSAELVLAKEIERALRQAEAPKDTQEAR